MPNWSESVYTIVGEEQELKELHKIMKRLESRKSPSVPNGFGTTWLGCLVDALDVDWRKVACRGEWSELEYHKGAITFNTMTAWSPCNEVWDLVRTKFPSIDYYYRTEEGGCGLYITNDADGTFYPERYHLTLCTGQGDYYEDVFETLAQVCSFIKKETGAVVETMKDIELLNDRMSEENEDAYCYINEYKVIR